jgi:hypothetical protein
LCNRRPTPGLDTVCAFDEERDQYLLLRVGWFQGRRVRGATLYVRLIDGKIHIEEDWTEDGIGNELLRAGVPREDIVLGFHAPEQQPATQLATA